MTADTNPVDEKVAAYLDDAMSAEARAEFEATCATDPALAAQVDRWRNNGRSLLHAFDTPISASLEAQLRDLIWTGTAVDPSSRPVAASAQVIDLADARARKEQAVVSPRSGWRRFALPAGCAIAASFALALVLTHQTPLPAPSSQSAGDPLQIALSTTASLSHAPLTGNAKVTPILTFAAQDGRLCRAYSVTSASNASSGVACRDGTAWRVEGTVPGSALPPSGDEYAAAGGAENPAFDALLAKLGAGVPLDAARENQLIASNWQSTAVVPSGAE